MYGNVHKHNGSHPGKKEIPLNLKENFLRVTFYALNLFQ